ncbi:MAG: DUF488 family protein [Thermogemmatispora sp.]|uniref:DUF488 domain-containing protein n=1 Tax=Thermogemmatispora sp. TaxID=1968838 RepID=UPI00260B8B1F|nr:DUF488 family protein [Thermogemmatispora sp.]MBX5456999.1 DUF488 family protein [Thermogemmatispora sp.]
MSGEAPLIRLKRVYEEAMESDGTRVLVERLWPRGLSRERARIDLWLKDVAPSDELRRWFAHDPQKFPEFRRRYEQELRDQEAARAALAHLLELARRGPLTLVYSARDREHNNAVVLRDLLERSAGTPS